MYKTLVAKEGEWHPISDFETRHAGKANIGYRIQELKYTGKRSGLWTVERSGDQVRIFVNKKGDIQQPVQTDQQLDRAAQAAKDYMALQKKYGETKVPYEESKALFNSYFKDMGVSTKSRNAMELAVRMWTGSVHNAEAQALRRVCVDFYNRDPKDEYTNGHSNSLTSQKIEEKAITMRSAVMALKAYTSAYAAQHNVNMVYRGVTGNYGDKVKKALANGDSVSVPMNCASSWSSKKSTASDFGGGVVFKMKIDPDNVWAAKAATPWLFSAHSHEDEYIVGTKMPKEVFKKSDIELSGW
jgi:hypothetical protein